MDIKQATTYSKEARQVMLGLFYAWHHHHQAGPRHRPSAPGSKPSLLPGNDRLARAERPWWSWHHHHQAGIDIDQAIDPAHQVQSHRCYPVTTAWRELSARGGHGTITTWQAPDIDPAHQVKCEAATASQYLRARQSL